MNDDLKDNNTKSTLAGNTPDKSNQTEKTRQLDQVRSDATDEALTTNQGVKIADNQNSLKAGVRGSTLLEEIGRAHV